MARRDHDGNSQQAGEFQRIVGAMGRAAGRHHATSGPCRRDPDAATASVKQLVRTLVGVCIADEGWLTSTYGGHPAGTRYMVLQADCALERELARRALTSLAGLPELAWEHGWRGRRLASGELVTELRIFPGAQLSAPVR